MENTAILVENINKQFTVGMQELHILKNINFSINDSEFVIIVGPSGSGKSTLLHTLLGLEVPTTGAVKFYGKDIYQGLTDDDRALFRKKHIGMIYQQPNWIKAFSVVENVAFPLLLLGMEKTTALTRAIEMLNRINMSKWAHYRPTELSGGQQQRISLARALINNPYVIVADEPTGNLDFESGQMVMELLSGLHKQQRKTVIMVTHDLEYLDYATKAIQILDGEVVQVYDHPKKESIIGNLRTKRGVVTQQPAPAPIAEAPANSI